MNWHPVYGGISQSGDLGFTTGPWTFQSKTTQDSIVARGQYSTVWKKGKDGEWKFIVDLGISKTPPFNDELYRFNSGAASFVPGTLKNLLTAEENFIRQTKDAETAVRKKQYEDVLSKKAFFLNCTGNLPATGLAEINKVLQTMPQKIGYAIDGSGISAAGDLGYVYGTTIINTQPENYLRIWRREGRDWKLVLEVLRY